MEPREIDIEEQLKLFHASRLVVDQPPTSPLLSSSSPQTQDPPMHIISLTEEGDMAWPKNADGELAPYIYATLINGGGGGGGAVVVKDAQGKDVATASGAGGPCGAKLYRKRIDYPEHAFEDAVRLRYWPGMAGKAGKNSALTLPTNFDDLMGTHTSGTSGTCGTSSTLVVEGFANMPLIVGPHPIRLYSQLRSPVSCCNGAKAKLHNGNLTLTLHAGSPTTQIGNFWDGRQSDKALKSKNDPSRAVVNRNWLIQQFTNASTDQGDKLPSLTIFMGSSNFSGSADDKIRQHQPLTNPQSFEVDVLRAGGGTVAWLQHMDAVKPIPAQVHPEMESHLTKWGFSFTKGIGFAQPVTAQVLKQQWQFDPMIRPNDFCWNIVIHEKAARAELNKFLETPDSTWTFGGAGALGHPCPGTSSMIGYGGLAGYFKKPGVFEEPQDGSPGRIVVEWPKKLR